MFDEQKKNDKKPTPAPPKQHGGKKKPFARLAKERGLSNARVAALKVCTGWEAETKITKADFDSAINKHLLGKE